MNAPTDLERKLLSATKSDLRWQLRNETRMTHRQKLLRAIWRLERRGVASAATRYELPAEAGGLTPLRQQSASVAIRSDERRDGVSLAVAATARKNAPPKKDLFEALNVLYLAQSFSLANYLQYAKPWTAPTERPITAVIERISTEQLRRANLIESLIVERGGHVNGGTFPQHFTAFNDLALAYMTLRLVDDQEWIIAEVAAQARQLQSDSKAHGLVTKILAAEQEHLKWLHNLIAEQDLRTRNPLAVTTRAETTCETLPQLCVATAA